MSTPIATSSNTRAGLCPHGLPPSACPICSGGGMGGVSRMRDTAVKSKPHANEWSYMKCYAAGMAMKAQQARAENAKSAFERQIEFAHNLNKSIQNLAQRIHNAIQIINNIAPKFISVTVQIIANTFINIISQLPKIIEKLAQFGQDIKNFVMQAAEKLAAVLGEIKNFIDNKILKNLKQKAKKFLLFFFTNIDEENYQNDDTLAVFKSREIKKYFVNIISKLKKRNGNEPGTSKDN